MSVRTRRSGGPAGPRRAPSRRRRVTLAAVVAAVLVTIIGTPAFGLGGHAANPNASNTCTVSTTLVNSCRPWIGAAARGNPGRPGEQPPKNEPIPQFDYLEQKLVGRNLDTFRDYHDCDGSVCSSGGLPFDPGNIQGQAEIHYADQGVYVDSNWTPAKNWAAAGGGDATVDAAIKQAAENIASVAPHKVFLSLGIEPQHKVTTPNCAMPGAPVINPGNTPADYDKMWENVENIFNNVFKQRQAVSNVVWAVDYQSDPTWDCLVPELWPGSSAEIDWVFYDTYDHDTTPAASTFDDTAGRFYRYLAGSPGGVDFAAVPWGLGELGTCKNPSPSNAQKYFLDAAKAVADDSYPNLKLYQVYADTSNSAGPGCLTDYDSDPATNPTYDPTKQIDFNQLVDTILNTRRD